MKQSRIMITGAGGFLGARAMQHFPGAISVPGALSGGSAPSSYLDVRSACIWGREWSESCEPGKLPSQCSRGSPARRRDVLFVSGISGDYVCTSGDFPAGASGAGRPRAGCGAQTP